jgi:hypothetical protein
MEIKTKGTVSISIEDFIEMSKCKELICRSIENCMVFEINGENHGCTFYLEQELMETMFPEECQEAKKKAVEKWEVKNQNV